jgi:hypothetical protein
VTVRAQQSISGRITDQRTGEAIEAAVIKLSGSNTTILSDRMGGFQLTLRGDSAELVVASIGYSTRRMGVAAGGKYTVALERSNLDLQEVVIISGAPRQQFRTISRIDLNLQPVKSSQELLRNVPGLFIAQHQGGGKAEQIFLRGFDIDHGTDVAISVDGLPVNMMSHAHGQGYADLHFVIPELVGKVDYGKGSYYTEAGNMSTAGYVNLQTLNRLEQNRVQAEVGSFNTFRGLAMFNLLGNQQQRQDAYVAAEYLYSDGPFQSPQHFNRYNVFGKYNYAFNPATRLSATLSHFGSRWNASGQIPQRAVDAGLIGRFGAIDDTEGGETNRSNIAIRLHHEAAGNIATEQLFYFSRYRFDLFSNFTFFLNDPVNGDQIRQREARNIFGYTAQVNWRHGGATNAVANNIRFNTLLGAGFRKDNTDGSELSRTKDKTIIRERVQWGNISELNVFAWAEERITAGNWLFSIGSRIDYFNFSYADKLVTQQKPAQQKLIVSPKLHAAYTFNKQLQLYFKAGKGFHSNDTRVAVLNGGGQVLPASYGSDIGVLWKPAPRLLINAALWHLYLQQEFVYVGDEGIVEPGGKTRRMGIDVSARYQLGKHIFADANINFAHARSIEAEKGMQYIPLAPALTSNGGIQYQAKRGFNGSLRYRYLKSRPANEDASVTAKGYFLLDAALNYTKPKYEIGIAAENVLNTRWNEAQFNTLSRLRNETAPVEEIHFTPGNPIGFKLRVAMFF